MYCTLSTLKQGDRVRVSGVFLTKPGAEDYLHEGGLTESGSMEEPEFFVNFTVVATQTKAPASEPVPGEAPASQLVLGEAPAKH